MEYFRQNPWLNASRSPLVKNQSGALHWLPSIVQSATAHSKPSGQPLGPSGPVGIGTSDASKLTTMKNGWRLAALELGMITTCKSIHNYIRIHTFKCWCEISSANLVPRWDITKSVGQSSTLPTFAGGSLITPLIENVLFGAGQGDHCNIN